MDLEKLSDNEVDELIYKTKHFFESFTLSIPLPIKIGYLNIYRQNKKQASLLKKLLGRPLLHVVSLS